MTGLTRIRVGLAGWSNPPAQRFKRAPGQTWHGAPRLYYSKYSQAQLAAFAAAVTSTRATETWCVFDNTARHAAWNDALQFIAAGGCGAQT